MHNSAYYYYIILVVSSRIWKLHAGKHNLVQPLPLSYVSQDNPPSLHSIEDPFQKTLQLSILCNAIRQDVMGENYISNLLAYRFDSDKKSEHALGKQHQTKQSMEDELFDLPTSSAPNPTDHMIMSSPRLMANGSNLEVMTSW